ncbi:MAG: hypothetical protein DHS20C14_20150 [Phycisphaeraceae bacterium]|nr:MAG: hypothetical protein DHS20C14_20150 [Phycisphaeraceae bacterium]
MTTGTRDLTMTTIPPTYSFPPTRGSNPQGPPAPSQRSPEARAQQTIDQVDIGASRAAAPGLNKLVAGQVDRPAIQGDAPALPTQPRPANPNADAIGLYAHPADRNAAATGVSLGRQIDISG